MRLLYGMASANGSLLRDLDYPAVEDVSTNEPGRVNVLLRGRSESPTTVLREGQVCDLVEQIVKSTRPRIDSSNRWWMRRQRASLAPEGPDAPQVHVCGWQEGS